MGLAEVVFLLVQEAAIDEGAGVGQDVTLPTSSGNGPRRREGAAASEARQSPEFALAVPTD